MDYSETKRLRDELDNAQFAQLIAERDAALAETARLRTLAAEAVGAFTAWVESDAAKGESYIPAMERLDAAMKALAETE